MKPTRWTSAEWAEANRLLAARCHGRCEVCGQPLHTGYTSHIASQTVRHHRQRRAVGGDRLSNLLMIHSGCHTDLHAHPDQARAKGWIVSAYVDDPAAVPVESPVYGVALLDDVGATHPAPPELMNA